MPRFGSLNSLRANWSSQRECRCEPRTCLQWPCESRSHQPAPLSASQRCRPGQRGIGLTGVVSGLLGQQDCTVLYRRRRRCHPSPARGFLCLSRLTTKNAPGLSLAVGRENSKQPTAFFLWPGAIVFRLVTTLEACLRTSGGIEPPPVVCPTKQPTALRNSYAGTQWVQ